MAKDILRALEILKKSHDYFGKAKDLNDHVGRIRKATDAAHGNIDRLQDLAGLDNKDVKKLVAKLDARAAATEAAAKAQFPEVPSHTAKAFWRVAAAQAKYGADSPQAKKERKGYIKALTAYDVALRERMAYCDVIAKTSAKQKAIYAGLHSAMVSSYAILDRLLKMPEIDASPHHEACFAMYVKYQAIGPSARAVAKAHERLILKARAHHTKVEKLKKENDAWIREMAKSELSKTVTSAMEALGF